LAMAPSIMDEQPAGQSNGSGSSSSGNVSDEDSELDVLELTTAITSTTATTQSPLVGYATTAGVSASAAVDTVQVQPALLVNSSGSSSSSCSSSSSDTASTSTTVAAAGCSPVPVTAALVYNGGTLSQQHGLVSRATESRLKHLAANASDALAVAGTSIDDTAPTAAPLLHLSSVALLQRLALQPLYHKLLLLLHTSLWSHLIICSVAG
jgi:hypothetical protein